MDSFKIALINPGPIINPKNNEGNSQVTHLYPPLGLLYLSAVLRQENFQVDMMDQAAYGFTLAQILKWIKKKDPDVLGFSTLISAASSVTARIISREIKKWNPNLKIIFGNKHATSNDYRILNKYHFIDACVRNEGEYSFLELVNAFAQNQSLENVKGITYRENGKVKRNIDREKIKDLDALPFPDRRELRVDYKAAFGGLDLAPSGFSSIPVSSLISCSICSLSALSNSCKASFASFFKESNFS